MKRGLTVAAVLLLLLLLTWFGALDRSPSSPGPQPTPEPTREVSEPPAIVDSPPELPEKGEAAPRITPEPEPIPDLGKGREGQVPAELLEKGDATLKLWVVDADSKEPVARSVTLWRLGVPAGDGWAGGDQIQAELEVPVAGATLADLPEGRYRVQCDEQMKSAPDPKSFVIGPGENLREVPLELPREFPAKLRVFDLEGNEIREGVLETGANAGWSRGSSRAPKWAKPRTPIRGTGYTFWGSRGSGRTIHWDRRPSQLAGDDGFDLGHHRESTRFKGKSGQHRLRIEGCCEVQASVPSDIDRPVTLCGLAVPMEKVLEGIALPDGAKESLADAVVTAVCYAEIHEKGEPFATAKTAKFLVRVQLADYKRLRYWWRADEPVEKRIFQPKL